ncbi:hypothetical protein, partial [Mycobacterium tuberculosis]|uniref:hypothetical protein n=1 Tax=Mycobacterium tuberculosis TaxID=1773 RepID=UPI002351E4F3
ALAAVAAVPTRTLAAADPTRRTTDPAGAAGSPVAALAALLTNADRDALSGPAVAASTALATHAAGTAIAVDSPVAEQRRAVAAVYLRLVRG